MKKLLTALLLVILAAGYLGVLIARDPGYVLIAHDGYTIQTSLWVFLSLLLGFLLLGYLFLRLFNLLRRAPFIYQGWQGGRQAGRTNKLMLKGLRLIEEGEFERAGRFLDGGAEHGAARGISYLAAARAADALGDAKARETYLRQSAQASPDLARAGAVVAAELALARGAPDVALDALQNVKPNRHILTLQGRALLDMQNWREILTALPALRKVDSLAASRLEHQAACLGFEREAGNDDLLNGLFGSLSAEARKDSDIVGAYVFALADKAQAEPLLRNVIKKSWQHALVELYGELGEASLKTRRKTAEVWARKHGDDAALQFCLGCIYKQGGEKGLAKDAFLRAIELGGGARASEYLGGLFADEGDLERSNHYLRLAAESKGGLISRCVHKDI